MMFWNCSYMSRNVKCPEEKAQKDGNIIQEKINVSCFFYLKLSSTGYCFTKCTNAKLEVIILVLIIHAVLSSLNINLSENSRLKKNDHIEGIFGCEKLPCLIFFMSSSLSSSFNSFTLSIKPSISPIPENNTWWDGNKHEHMLNKVIQSYH